MVFSDFTFNEEDKCIIRETLSKNEETAILKVGLHTYLYDFIKDNEKEEYQINLGGEFQCMVSFDELHEWIGEVL